MDTATAPLLIKPTANRRVFRTWRAFFLSEVDPQHATGPLTAFCFMTGFIDAISFTAAFVWCGFQTGNFAQLALALARILSTNDSAQRVLLPADLLALTSILAFNVGAFFGGRSGDRVGPHTRAWLSGATLSQALLTFLAALCIHTSGEDSISLGRGVPAWNSILSSIAMGLMAASLGVQGVIGKRLGTNFSTTVVLTALWIELVADPHLFKSPLKRFANRDHRVLALTALFVGAISARLGLIWLGAVGTLLMAVVVRVFIAWWWLVVQGKEVVESMDDAEERERGYGAIDGV
uniref:DUF1275 domain protein n=1 Tax=Mycena chlorophos TaxID=658473 RepID=A0ABQ0LUS6_MYCCL|nr:predicted protein [Mycena chlorophos]